MTAYQCYTYDSLNRLSTAQERSATSCAGTQHWSQNFGYDRFGNRTSLTGSGVPIPTTPTVDPATNRFQSGYLYDNAGNVTNDGLGNQYQYDAENHQTSYVRTGLSTNYLYDGDGHRVIKAVTQGGVTPTTVFVYNVAVQLIAEYSDPMPAREGGTKYLTADHLGSTRVVTGSDVSVKARHDYLPFGEDIGSIGGRGSVTGYSASDSTRQKFTQKERDSESGLDYFLARYYSSAQGRFLSTDPVRGSTRTPQTWNLYIYVLNNPFRFIDPTGKSHYEKTEIDGNTQDILVGDYDNEHVKGAGYWNAKTREWGKYHDWTPGLPLSSRLIFQDLARREKASMQAIGAFAGGTALAGSGIGAGVFVSGGIGGLTTLGLSGGGGIVYGLTGTTTVATLETLAASGGATEAVVTNLTQAPAAGQVLSVATGEGSEALASAARTGGQLFRAEIPKALLNELERVGLAFRSTTQMAGATAGEIRFAAQATRFLVKFFK